MDERGMIECLRSARGDPVKQQSILKDYWRRDSPLVRKALWSYRQVSLSAGDLGQDEDFIDGFLRSLAQNAVLAADASDEEIDCETVTLQDRTLFLSWHFKTYPAVGKWLLDRGVATIIARDSAIFDAWSGKGLCLNFRKPTFGSQIAKRLRTNSPILAMFDYCYPESRAIASPFLGHSCRTPIGLLELGRRFGYSARILAPRGDSIVVVDSFQLSADQESNVGRINRVLEQEIVLRPTEWLMWPAFDQRWDQNA